MKSFFTKSIFCFLALLFLLKAPSFAQAMRNVDIMPRIILPQPGTYIPNGSPLQLTLSYKNLGPDELQATDTIRIAWFMDNFLVLVGSSSGPLDSFIAKETAHSLLPGDSFIVNYPPILFGNLPSDRYDNCFRTYTYGADLQDPVTSNNSACVLISYGSLGVDDLSGEIVAFYPQPANNLLSWKIPSGKNVREVIVHDLMGRGVIKKETAPSENSLDVSHLPDGIYNVQMVFTGGEVYRQRIQVRHQQ